MSRHSDSRQEQRADTRRVQVRPPGSTWASLGTSRILRDRRARLGTAGLVLAGVYFLALVLFPVIIPLLHERQVRPLWLTVVVGSIAISLLVAWLARRPWYEERRLEGLAGTYQVLLAFGISLADLTMPADGIVPAWGISWICVLLVVFPFLVPTGPRRTLLTSLATAGMLPFAYIVLYVVTAHDPTFPRLVHLSVPALLAAVLAVAPATLLSRMERDARRARELGSYRLIEQLGQGGMGEVWRAEHHMLARPAAVKLIRADTLAHDDEHAEAARARFEREAQATALLQSPHSIELFDFGVTEDGDFYYVMELLDGFDLQGLVENHGPMPPERVAHVMLQACDSLADAHSHGLVHRDVKPANMYLCRKGRTVDYLKVLDFGLVTWENPGDGDVPDTRLTDPGTTHGTPGYMAPEMIRGKPVDGRADLYALGCVAYWLLTGRLVFSAGTTTATLVDHLTEPPTPPSKRMDTPLPGELEELILDLLAKKPEDRPESAELVGDRLMAMRFDEPWTAAKARAWWLEHQPPEPEVPAEP